MIKAQGVTMATRFLCTVEAEKLYESTGLGFVNLGRNLSKDLFFFWGDSRSKDKHEQVVV